MTEKDVRVAKSVSYLLLSILVIGAYYTIATLTYGVDMKSYFTGVFVFVSLIIYQLGIFLVVAKDEPLKFLFDGMMFSGYSISMLLVMIPLSMVGLYGTEIPSVVNRVAIGVCGVCFLLGLVLLRVKLRDKDKRFL